MSEKKPKKIVEKKATVETKKPDAPFDKAKAYSIAEAIDLTKKLSKTKFDASVEVHFKLGIDIKKGEQQVRVAVPLPHGTGKTIKIAAFVTTAKEKEVREAGADIVGGEELIAEIKKTEKTDFQVAVAEPIMMKNLGQIAKILGTRGLMPSPKNDTVTPDPAKAVKELKKGKVSLKNDDTGNVHVAIGKISFESPKLIQNFEVLLEAIRKAKPPTSKGIYLKNITICSTMGPGIKIAI
ncbi:MAG: 50S ribosomal protein L1 [bacterium]|nr:50S ribosomal protein L1 [bacterium]